MTLTIEATLPLRRDLTVAYASSLMAALALAAVSIAGLVLGCNGVYDPESPLVQVSRGGDAANLVLGLPILLGSASLAGCALLRPTGFGQMGPVSTRK